MAVVQIRLRACLAAIGGVLAITAATPVPAQAHVLTCVNTRAFATGQLHKYFDVSAGPVNSRVTRVGPCRAYANALSHGHRHKVFWEFAVQGTIYSPQGPVVRNTQQTAAVTSTDTKARGISAGNPALLNLAAVTGTDIADPCSGAPRCPGH